MLNEAGEDLGTVNIAAGGQLNGNRETKLNAPSE
jgi:hypothetical protein